jgi:small subunit ribosomal protein S1
MVVGGDPFSSGIEKDENGVNYPELDEGWWAAILSDEEQYFSEPPPGNDNQLARPNNYKNVDWEWVQNLHDEDEIIELQVHSYNRGGLLVQGENIQGFVPVSHLVEMPNDCDEENRNVVMKTYIGRTLSLKVIECDSSQDRVVLSERAALAGEGCRKRLLQNLQQGEKVCGTVTNVTDFGAFVDLGGVEGLIHVSELSWGRVQHPTDILYVQQKIETIVLHVSEEDERVALSYKRLFPNPWEDIQNYYNPGDIVPAKITSIMKYGAFARMKEGIEGLIHISSLKVRPGNHKLEDLLQPGQSVMVKILHIDVDRRRLGLGLEETE